MLNVRFAVVVALTQWACLASLTAQTVYPTGTTIWNKQKTWSGHTLFPAANGEGTLIDMSGKVLRTWKSPIAGERLILVEPLDNGNVLAASGPPGPRSQTVIEFDQTGKVVWAYYLSPMLGFIHHDIERLPNGNTLLLCAQTITVPSISSIPLIDDYILEIDPNGNAVWGWFTWQHFAEFGFDAEAKSLIAAQGGDWAHANAVDPLPASQHTTQALRAGNLVVSQRYTNIVFIIDRTTGSVAWKVGPDDNMTHGQHAPHMIEQGSAGAGNILVFDNGAGTGYPLQGRSPGYSSVIEIDPVNKTRAWTYDAGYSGLLNRLFYSDVVSNAQRLPNGNTFICSGVKGRFFEVTRSGQIVWEYMSPILGSVGGGLAPFTYRARRVSPSWSSGALPTTTPVAR